MSNTALVICAMRVTKSMAFFVTLTLKICNDLIPFFLVLSLTMLSFSHIYYFISTQNLDEKDQFAGKFYENALTYAFDILAGSIDIKKVGQIDSSFTQFTIIVFAILGYFVLLNALISIMSNSFEKVNQKVDIIFYK